METENKQTDRFQDLFYTHYPTVLRKLNALVRNEATAEDLAQEVFLRLYRNPPLDLHAVGAWLHRVAIRIGYDYLNKQKRERVLQEKQAAQLLAHHGDVPSGENLALQKLDEENVQQWLEQLPEQDRNLLLLRYSGYSYAEIAAKLQVNQPSVGMLVQRATSKLKRQANIKVQFE